MTSENEGHKSPNHRCHWRGEGPRSTGNSDYTIFFLHINVSQYSVIILGTLYNQKRLWSLPIMAAPPAILMVSDCSSTGRSSHRATWHQRQQYWTSPGTPQTPPSVRLPHTDDSDGSDSTWTNPTLSGSTIELQLHQQLCHKVPAPSY